MAKASSQTVANEFLTEKGNPRNQNLASESRRCLDSELAVSPACGNEDYSKMGAEAAVCELLSFQSSLVRNMELYLGNHNRGRERHTQREREGRDGINCL